MGEVTEYDVRTVGTASAPVHHGEILQGIFRHQGSLRRGLVTLPCPLYRVHAAFVPSGGRDSLVITPHWKSKAAAAAELTLTELGLPCGGRLELTGDVPVSRGFGSSTSDVLAAIRAVSDTFSHVLPDEDIARIAVRAETASDSLMFGPTALLFAHRDGDVLEDYGSPLPPARVLGFGARPHGRARGVDTLAVAPARYTPRQIDRFAELRAMLRQAVLTKDVALLGEVATASTRINQEHLPIPELEHLLAVVREVGAVGLQAAHSGDIAGMVFDRNDPDVHTRVAHARQLLHDIGITEQWDFSTDD
ncbi:GHMP family kinase ATP-binding protein [Streptomyces sp. NPDC003032]